MNEFNDIIENNEIIMESLVNDVDITMEGQRVEAYDMWKNYGTQIKRKYYKAEMLFLKRNYDEAIKLFKEVISEANDLKQKVHSIPKDKDNILQTILTNIKVSTIKTSSSTGYERTTYIDDKSENSPNRVQENIQKALNLLIAKSQKEISNIQSKMNR